MQTITQHIEAITNSNADRDERILCRCDIGSVVHQGDVYLVRVADDHPRGAPWGSRQVAIGTQTGSRHVVVGDEVDVFAGVASNTLQPLFSADQRAACLGPVVVAGQSFRLDHPEHAAHVLPAGTYQVLYQWDEQTMARVSD